MDRKKKDFVMTIDDVDMGDMDDDPEDEELEINKKEGFAFDFDDAEPVVAASPWNFATAKKKLLQRNSIPTTSVDEKIQRQIQTRTKEEERKKKQAALQKELDEAEVEYMGSVSLESASGSDSGDDEDGDEEGDDSDDDSDEGDEEDVMEEVENDDDDADSDSDDEDNAHVDQNEFVGSDNDNEDENDDSDDDSDDDDEGDDDDGDGENGAEEEDQLEDMKTDVLKDLPKRKGKNKKETYFSERISGPTKDLTFDALQISRPLLKAINELGYKTPTVVQQTTIPVALKGLDICGSAVTGSGKTAAFVLPILERLLWRDLHLPAIRVLILAPTRELAIQCHSVIENLAKYTNIRAALITGGMAIKPQEVELRTFPDILVGTPGRMIDHLRNTMSFGLDSLDILVLDEADRLLEMGFFEEVEQIVKMCPKKRQTMLFSATMTEQVDKLIRLSMEKPVRVAVDPMFQMAKKLTQEFVRIKGPREPERPAFLLALCTRTFKTKTIVFFQHKHTCHQMRIYFGLAGLKAGEIHGDLPQDKRLESLENFRDGKVDFLLATDVAARGLDIVGIQTVINYTLPGNIQSYVHRVGRTARAEGTGRAVSLIGEKDRKMLKEVLKYQAANTKQRVLPPEAIVEWKEKLAKFHEDAQAIMRQEVVEKELRTADMEANKVKNMIEHEAEIYSRPKKTWFIGDKERKQLKEDSVRQAKGEALNKEDVRDSRKRKREEMDDKKKKGDWESKKRQRTEEVKEADRLMKSAKRTNKPLSKKKKLKDMTDKDLLNPHAKRKIAQAEKKGKSGGKKKGKSGSFGTEVKRAKFSEDKTFIPGKKRGKSGFKSKMRHKRR